jgi:carboxymethylenebutenolidase
MENLKQDLDSLAAQTHLSGEVNRRAFLKTALGTGFAASVMPVCAQTVIQTDSVGLEVGEVIIDVKGTKLPMYCARPAGKTNLPVVLVISEIFGVHEHIADMARRYAKAGYLAIAPELFVRQGDPSSFGTMAELMEKIIYKTPDSDVMGDLDACVAWAGANGGNPDKLGITGYCWGGRITWMYCAHNPKVKAGVALYGRLVGQKSAINPQHPIDVVGAIKSRVLGLYGGQDTGIPLASVEQMKAALAAAGDHSDFVIYPDAGHAFNADYRPSYVAAAAKDGWLRSLAWFKAHGVN